MSQLPIFITGVVTIPITRTDRQILALVRKAKKYPSAKKKIAEIKDKRRRAEWLGR